MKHSKLAVTVVLGVVGLASWAPASEPVVANKLYDLGGRFELTLSPVMSIVDKYTRHVGVTLSGGYYFNDYIGLEAEFGYNFIASDKKLLNEILTTATPNAIQGVERLPLNDLKRLQWAGTLSVFLSPLYGKIDFSAELAVSLHLYFLLGGGAGQYRYSELVWSGPGAFDKHTVSYGIKPTILVAGGLLFHINRNFSVRLEIRDMFFYDNYKAQKREVTDVVEVPIKDFNHTTFLRLGVGYAF